MSFTVVPIHNLSFPLDASIPFGDEFELTPVPVWVTESALFPSLSQQDQQAVGRADHAFVAEYEASTIGERDLDHIGEEFASIQQNKSFGAIMANLALWLIQPSSACFTVSFHAISRKISGVSNTFPTVQQIETRVPLYCHENDLKKAVSVEQAEIAGRLYPLLRSVPRQSAVWGSTRLFWAGLTTYSSDIRYSLLWMGLEALLGSDNSNELAYKLSQRIAFLISTTPEMAKDNFRKARTCYNTRSKIVHGRWQYDPAMLHLMADTENIVRRVLLRVLNDPEFLSKLVSKERDAFLEDMVFSRYQ